MRPFSILICLFLILNVSFTAIAVSVSEDAIVSVCASGEGPDGPENGFCVTKQFDIKDDFCQPMMAQNTNTFKTEVATTLSPRDG